MNLKKSQDRIIDLMSRFVDWIKDEKTTLLKLLDILIEAGWSDALRLLWGLDAIIR